jgi:ferredoxin
MIEMVKRNIVSINEELCNGCGQCIPNCAEGALQIVDGKAKIISDIYCDGLGACLGHCPEDAIEIIEREALPFDEEAVEKLLSQDKKLECGCPSSLVQNLEANVTEKKPESALRQWPVQLTLLPLEAPFYKDAELLVLADCVPVAYPRLHESLLPGRTVMVGCPKLDDASAYVEKLGTILRRNSIRNITLAHMEVPCCSGLKWIVERAVEASGKNIPVRSHILTLKGEMK